MLKLIAHGHRLQPTAAKPLRARRFLAGYPQFKPFSWPQTAAQRAYMETNRGRHARRHGSGVHYCAGVGYQVGG